MSHPADSKNKYKHLNKQMAQFADIIQKYSYALMTLDQELRNLKNELQDKGVIETPVEETQEPEEAKESEYFGKSEGTEDSLQQERPEVGNSVEHNEE